MRRILNRARATSGEDGAVIVEMAFALPLLALIFLVIIDLGLVVREFQVLQNAAREGARFSSLPANQIALSADPAATQTAIKQFVVSYAAEGKVTVDVANVQIDQAYVIPGGCGSEITVTYARPMLFLGGPFLKGGSMTLTGRSVFYNLYGC